MHRKVMHLHYLTKVIDISKDLQKYLLILLQRLTKPLIPLIFKGESFFF